MRHPIRTSLLAAASLLTIAACNSSSGEQGLQSRLDVADATIIEKNETIALLNVQVSELQASVVALESSVASLEAQVAAGNVSIATLNESIAALDAEKVALTAQLTALQSEYAAFIAATNTTTGELASDLAAVRSTLAVTEADLATTQAALANLQIDFDTYSQTAFNNLKDRTDYERLVSTDASDVASAQSAFDTAEQNRLVAVNAHAVAVAYSLPVEALGQTLATFIANDRPLAEQYAALVGLDPANNVDQDALVSQNELDAAISNLLTAKTNAESIAATASTNLSNVQAAYTANFGGINKGTATRLYRADGAELVAEGAAIFGAPDATQNGEQVPVVARLTTLFLLDENSNPSEMLVWEGTGSPFAGAPVGSAVFTSNSMVAYFAQQQGNGAYRLLNQDDAGNLTLDFTSETGLLSLGGIQNGANLDYSITAQLVFDPQTGQFTGSGDQAYTNANSSSEVAAATISGSLHGASEAFTAIINASDTTNPSVPVTILTAIGGSGSVTSN